MALHTLIIIVRRMWKIFLSKFNFFLCLLKFHFFACLPANSIGSGRRFLHKDLIDVGPGNDSNLLGRFADFAQNGSMATVIGQSIKKSGRPEKSPTYLDFYLKSIRGNWGRWQDSLTCLDFYKVMIQTPSACLIKKKSQDWTKKYSKPIALQWFYFIFIKVAIE